MRGRDFMTLAALIVLSCEARATCPDHSFYSVEKDDGTRVGLVSTAKDMARDPAWTPGLSEPPLAPGRAYALALSWARSNWKHFDAFGLETIALEAFGCDYQKWIYVVSLAPLVDGDRLHGAGYFLGVLMDGTIVAPTPLKKDF